MLMMHCEIGSVLNPPELVYDRRIKPGDRENWHMRGYKFYCPSESHHLLLKMC